MTILAFAGSFREGSYNQGLVQAAQELAPEGVQVRTFDLSRLPFYDADVDQDGLRPQVVLEFEREIRQADAVFIATPEYNHVIPGVLGNALDWASRKLGSTPPLKDKPVAVVGASPGIAGTARAQDHLKLILLTIGADILMGPGLLVNAAHKKFEDGRLQDEKAREILADILVRLTEAVDVPAEVA